MVGIFIEVMYSIALAILKMGMERLSSFGT